MDERLFVNEKEYKIIKLLGKGKGGYSYLAENNGKEYVLKQIHHEPCDYYQFGNKIQSEIDDYKKLKEIGIRIPELIDVDIEKERIIKEYIDGPTIYDLVKEGNDVCEYIKQVEVMCNLLYEKDTNIDYFPTNFIVSNDLLYYIDFECNKYMDEWNFANWGIKYWSPNIDLLNNLDKLHTTELGVVRIKRNLLLDTDDVVEWCREKITSDAAAITRNGKNWYINIDDCIITVNAYSYTVITAHKY